MKQINLKENPTKLPPVFVEVLIWLYGPEKQYLEKPYMGWMVERKESKFGIECRFGYFNPALMTDKDNGYREIDSTDLIAWCHLPKFKK